MNKTISLCTFLILTTILLAGSLITSAISLAAENDKQSTQPYTLNITGNTNFSEKDLLKAAGTELQMFAQKGYRKADIDDAAFQMRSAYILAGFAFAFVDYTYEEKESSVKVTFKVEEGPRVEIEQIIFTGNEQIGADILLGFFPEAKSLLGGQQKRIFVEAEVKDVLSQIRDYYRGEGFADVIVKAPELSFTEHRTGVSITIRIEEGPKYIINEVVLSGDLIAELGPEFEKIKGNYIGKSYYARRKLLLRTDLEEAYDSIGYAKAGIDVEAVFQEESGGTTMQAAISTGEKVRIGDIVISGNTSTREAFIRDRVQLKPGDIYSNSKKMESFRKLFDSGLFAKIEINLLPPGPEGSRDLEVAVKELPTREYYVEPGWGSYEALRLAAGVFEKNLLGTGRNGRIDGLVSTKGEKFTVSYTDPWLLQTDISMNIPLFYDRREEPSYTSEEIGFLVLLSRKISRNLTVSSGYQYKTTQLYSLADETPLPKGEDDYNKGTVGILAVWDTRDDIFYPTKGLRLTGGFDISLPAFGSDLDYGRIALGCRYFIKLPQEYIIGLRATTGLIIPISGQLFIPISERFFNGGDTTVRSYYHSELGPKDENNEPVGGLGYNVFSVELRKIFYKDFSATLYVDAGNVSPNRSLLQGPVSYASSSDLLDDTLNDFFSEFKFGIGIGFQYLLPVGPIRIDAAYNPDPEEIWQEDSWAFHFSLGMAF